MATPKWMVEKTIKQKSLKAEKSLAKQVGGKTYINSGATLGQNDVFNNQYDFEHKITGKESYILRHADLKKMVDKTKTDKVPVFVIEFGNSGKKFAVLQFSDFEELM